MPPSGWSLVKHRYIFEHERFRMVCELVYDEGELVEVTREQEGEIFGTMQKDKKLAIAVIDWANDLDAIQKEEGWDEEQ